MARDCWNIREIMKSAKSMNVDEKLDIYNRYFKAKWPRQNHLVRFAVTFKMPECFRAVACVRIGNGEYAVAMKGENANTVNEAISTSGLQDMIVGNTPEEAYEKWERFVKTHLNLNWKSLAEMQLWLEIAGI